MLKVLHQKLEQPDSPRNIELVRGEASKTTLGSKCADVVLIANVWHELDDHEGALQEAARILLPGGTLALLDWRPDRNSPPGPPSDHRLSASDVVKFLTKAQLDDSAASQSWTLQLFHKRSSTRLGRANLRTQPRRKHIDSGNIWEFY